MVYRNSTSSNREVYIDSFKIGALGEEGSGDTTAPSIPTGLTVDSKTETSVSLSWSASTDDTGVAGYKVYQDSAEVDDVSTTNVTVSNLTANTEYTFAVSAYDAAQNESDLSTPVVVTTDEEEPPIIGHRLTYDGTDWRMRKDSVLLSTGWSHGVEAVNSRWFGACITPWALEEGFDTADQYAGTLIKHANLWWYRLTSATDGSIELIPDVTEDWFDRVANLQAAGVKVLMLVHNHIDLGTGYEWNRDHLMTVLENPTARANNIDQIVSEAVARGFDGIEIDYENLDGDQGDDQTILTFMQELYPAAKAAGLIVDMAAPNRTTIEGPDASERAFNPGDLHPYLDTYRIMTYDYSGGWSDPGPIAPYQWVDQGIQYALNSGMPAEKIALGLHFWGLDWNITQGTSTDLLSSDVDQLIALHSPTVQWHASYREHYFTYTANGDDHEVWFASPEQIADRSALANKYELGGVYGWYQSGEEDPDFYPQIAAEWINGTPPGEVEGVWHIGATTHADYTTKSTLLVPYGTQEGDSLIMIAATNWDEGITLDEPGWALAFEQELGIADHTLRIYARLASASEPSSYGITWTGTDQWRAVALHALKSAQFADLPSVVTSATKTVQFPQLSVQQGDVVFLAASTVGQGDRQITPAPGNVWIDGGLIMTASEPMAAAGTTPAFTLTIDADDAGIIAVAFILQ